MTHPAPMPDSAGDFSSAGQSKRFCKHCKGDTVFKCEKWESSCGGYEDYKYTCTCCQHGFWIEGCDS